MHTSSWGFLMVNYTKFYALAVCLTVTIGVPAVQAQSISSATCSSPTVVVTFASSVNAVTSATNSSSISNSVLSALKFKKDVNSSDTVDLDTVNGSWNSAKTEYTVYPTLKNYRDVNTWDVWPLAVSATASGVTSSVLCQ